VDQHDLHAFFHPNRCACQELDKYLRTAEVRFRELFAQFDQDSSGTLDPGELRDLVRAFLPTSSPQQLAYFQVHCTEDAGSRMSERKAVQSICWPGGPVQ
jgi:Ca2+-binding EF-hand superfamily protein